MSKIESVNIDYNDDDTISYRIHYKPDKKKSSNGAEQVMYLDAITGSAKTIEEVLEKIKNGKDYPKDEKNEDD